MLMPDPWANYGRTCVGVADKSSNTWKYMGMHKFYKCILGNIRDIHCREWPQLLVPYFGETNERAKYTHRARLGGQATRENVA